MRTITLKREGDKIAFINQAGTTVADLYDGDSEIIIDKFADSLDALGMYEDGLTWDKWFAENGINVQSARLIDAMPSPDINL